MLPRCAFFCAAIASLSADRPGVDGVLFEVGFCGVGTLLDVDPTLPGLAGSFSNSVRDFVSRFDIILCHVSEQGSVGSFVKQGGLTHRNDLATHGQRPKRCCAWLP